VAARPPTGRPPRADDVPDPPHVCHAGPVERGTLDWVAKMLGHRTTQMVIRHYHKHVPNLTRRDGGRARPGAGQAAEAAMTRCGGYHLVTRRTKGATGCPVTPRQDGAGDRNRTGDVQLGNFLSALSQNVTSYQNSSLPATRSVPASHDLSFLLTLFGQHLGQQVPDAASCRTSICGAGEKRGSRCSGIPEHGRSTRRLSKHTGSAT
jgi:hypothetical protein